MNKTKSKWFIAKSEYINNIGKRVVLTQAVYANNFEEAENKVISDNQPYCEDEITIVSLTHAPFSIVINAVEGQEIFFKAKVSFINYEERKGEKSVKENFLIGADDISSALCVLKKHLSDSVTDTRIEALQLSSIQELLNNPEP